MAQSGGIQQPPDDGIHWCTEELPLHDNCRKDCTLARALRKYDAMVAVDINSDTNKKTVSEATEFVQAMAKQLGEKHPNFKCIPWLRGSCANGMKVGRLDEIDFLLKMEENPVKAEDGWITMRDSECYRLNYLPEEQFYPVGVGRENSYQFFKPKRSKAPETAEHEVEKDSCQSTSSVNDDAEAMNTDVRNSIYSASKYKSAFVRALESTIVDMGYEACVTEDETRQVKSRFAFDTNIDTLLLFPSHIQYAVKIDLTPCICYTDPAGAVWFVPRRKLQNWTPVNEDPKEFDCTVVKQAVRVLKALRDASASTTEKTDSDDSYSEFYSNVYSIIEENETGFTCHGILSKLVTERFDRPKLIVPDAVVLIPSFAVAGSVVKQYRTNTEQSLCSLVTKSLVNFEFINPSGESLCRLENLITPFSDDPSSWIEEKDILNKCAKNLHKLEGTELEGAVSQEILPDCYRDKPRCLAQDLQKNYEQTFQILETDLRGEPYERGQKSETSLTPAPICHAIWIVYGIQAGDLSTLLLEELPHEDYVLQDFVSCKQKENCELYVAVQASWNTIARNTTTGYPSTDVEVQHYSDMYGLLKRISSLLQKSKGLRFFSFRARN